MSAQENPAAVHALNDAFNARDWEAASALATAAVDVVNVATGATLHGPEGLRQVPVRLGPRRFPTVR